MAVSEAQKRARDKHDAKNYSYISVKYKNQLNLKQRIQKVAEKSVNKYIIDAVLEKLEREENEEK